MNPTKLELIAEIRAGKALHYDIDNVELLNEVIHEAAPLKGQLFGYYIYYYLENDKLECSDRTTLESIPLSSFLPKMIEVERVREKLNEMLQDYKDEGNSDNSNINNRVIGAIRACNQLLTFLNTPTNE